MKRGKTRKFGGKVYRYRVSSSKKTEARHAAEGYRDGGLKARIVKSPGHPVVYDVYTR